MVSFNLVSCLLSTTVRYSLFFPLRCAAPEVSHSRLLLFFLSRHGEGRPKGNKQSSLHLQHSTCFVRCTYIRVHTFHFINQPARKNTVRYNNQCTMYKPSVTQVQNPRLELTTLPRVMLLFQALSLLSHQTQNPPTTNIIVYHKYTCACKSLQACKPASLKQNSRGGGRGGSWRLFYYLQR